MGLAQRGELGKPREPLWIVWGPFGAIVERFPESTNYTVFQGVFPAKSIASGTSGDCWKVLGKAVPASVERAAKRAVEQQFEGPG
jgi:hypothetical protein